MNKILELLEQYCQWIAIALGAIFLSWVLYAYLLLSPASKKVRDTVLTPGTVDDYVKKMYAEPLDHEITSPTTETPPNSHVSLIEPWDKAMRGIDSPVLTLNSDWPGSQPQSVRWTGEVKQAAATTLVKALPELPASTPLDLKAARAFVAGGANPVAPAGAPAPAAPVQPAGGRDVNYVRLTYSIDAPAIAAAFKAKEIPQGADTSIVQIVLMRQELIGPDKWSDSSPVALIGTLQPLPAVPGVSAAPGDVQLFREFIESEQGETDLLRPPFFQVLSGEGPWDAPVDDMAATAVADQDAAGQKKKAVEPPAAAASAAKDAAAKAAAARAAAAKAAAAKTERQPNRPMQSPESSPGARQPRDSRSGKKSGVAEDPSRPHDLASLAGLQLVQAAPPPADPDAAAAEPAAVPVPIAPAAAPIALPPARFNPAGIQPIVAWAFDETVKEGHTYRYQVVYAIRNPVFGANQNIVADPALAQQFAISSKLDTAAWSQLITVKSTTEFYLASPNWPPGNPPSNVRMEIFKWANGKWQSRPVLVSPGDRIGDKTGPIDFGTEDALVDINFDRLRNRAYILVLGADGKLTERDPSTDRNDPRHKRLQGLVNSTPGPAAAAARPPLPTAG